MLDPDGEHASIWPLLDGRRDKDVLISELVGSYFLNLHSAPSTPDGKLDITRQFLTKLKVFFDHQLCYSVNRIASKDHVISGDLCFKTLVLVIDIGLEAENDLSFRSLVFFTILAIFRAFSLYPEKLDRTRADALRRKFANIQQAWGRQDGDVSHFILSTWLPATVDFLRRPFTGRWTIREFGSLDSYKSRYQQLDRSPFCSNSLNATQQDITASIEDCAHVIRVAFRSSADGGGLEAFWDSYDVAWALLELSTASQLKAAPFHTLPAVQNLYEMVQGLQAQSGRPSQLVLQYFMIDSISHLSGQSQLPFSTLLSDATKGVIGKAIDDFENYLTKRDETLKEQYQEAPKPEVDESSQPRRTLTGPTIRGSPDPGASRYSHLFSDKPWGNGGPLLQSSELFASYLEAPSRIGQSMVMCPQVSASYNPYQQSINPPASLVVESEGGESRTPSISSTSGTSISNIPGDATHSLAWDLHSRSATHPELVIPTAPLGPPFSNELRPHMSSRKDSYSTRNSGSSGRSGATFSAMKGKLTSFKRFATGEREGRVEGAAKIGLPEHLRFSFSNAADRIFLWDKGDAARIAIIDTTGSKFQRGWKVNIHEHVKDATFAEAGVVGGSDTVATVVYDGSEKRYKVLCFKIRQAEILEPLVAQLPEGDGLPKAMAISRDRESPLLAVACETKVYVYRLQNDKLIVCSKLFGLKAFGAGHKTKTGQLRQRASFSLNSEVLIVATQMPPDTKGQKRANVYIRAWSCRSEGSTEPTRPFLDQLTDLSAGGTDDKGILSVFSAPIKEMDEGRRTSWLAFLAACDSTAYHSTFLPTGDKLLIDRRCSRLAAATQGPRGPDGDVQYLFIATSGKLYLHTNLRTTVPKDITKVTSFHPGPPAEVGLTDDGYGLVVWKSGDSLMLGRVDTKKEHGSAELQGCKIEGLFQELVARG